MSIQIQFELTLDDWKEVMWLRRRRSTPGSQPLRWMNPLCASAAAVGIVLLFGHPAGIGWVAPVALIFFGLFVPFQMISAREAATNEAWSKAARRIHPTTWTFDHPHARSYGLHYDVTYNWAIFTSWCEGPTIIALYVDSDTFYTIPKRAFADARQLDDFRRLLNSHIIPASTGGFPMSPKPPAGE
jgi:hypothetical protein